MEFAKETPKNARAAGGKDASAYRDIYERLRGLAKRERRRVQAGTTLSTTALVHQVWIDLCDANKSGVAPRDFYAYAGMAMRNLLVDEARRAIRPKHGGGLKRVEWDAEGVMALDSAHCIESALELDQALRRLESEDARAARVVEMHYFAGLELTEVAELLEVSLRTVNRDWRFARAYLHDALARS